MGFCDQRHTAAALTPGKKHVRNFAGSCVGSIACLNELGRCIAVGYGI
jgi:hypothetical protein